MLRALTIRLKLHTLNALQRLWHVVLASRICIHSEVSQLSHTGLVHADLNEKVFSFWVELPIWVLALKIVRLFASLPC